MNDQEFAAAVEAVLEQFYRGQMSAYEALTMISQLKGAHAMWRAGKPDAGQQ